MPDPVEAVLAFLGADTDIAALISTRAFGGELPEAEQPSMPQLCLVVREAGGGLLGTGYEQFTDIRFDVLTFGATRPEASELWRAVHVAMKRILRVKVGGMLLHWAKQSGGPTPVRDPDTQHPYVVSSWQVLISEVAAT